MKCEAALAAADRGSLTAAAELLGYTQSGVTRMVGALEEELGFALFSRSKRGVVLTENGRLMLPLFRDLVRACRGVEQQGAEIRGMSRGVLTIGCYYSISAIWMPRLLKGFCAKYPGVKVRLQEGGNGEMSRWLGERSVDCCFCAQPERTEYPWKPLFEDELVAWLPPDHPRAAEKRFPVKDLEREDFIHTSPGQDTDQDRLLARLGIAPRTRFSTRDGFSTYNMVAAGLGISFNQRLIARQWSGPVVQLPFDPPQKVTLGIAVPNCRDASPITRRFIQWVEENREAVE